MFEEQETGQNKCRKEGRVCTGNRAEGGENSKRGAVVGDKITEDGSKSGR